LLVLRWGVRTAKGRRADEGSEEEWRGFFCFGEKRVIESESAGRLNRRDRF